MTSHLVRHDVPIRTQSSSPEREAAPEGNYPKNCTAVWLFPQRGRGQLLRQATPSRETALGSVCSLPVGDKCLRKQQKQYLKGEPRRSGCLWRNRSSLILVLISQPSAGPLSGISGPLTGSDTGPSPPSTRYLFVSPQEPFPQKHVHVRRCGTLPAAPLFVLSGQLHRRAATEVTRRPLTRGHGAAEHLPSHESAGMGGGVGGGVCTALHRR